MAAAQIFCAGGDGKEVEDAVVIDLIHGNEDCVLSVLLDGHAERADIGELRESGGALRESAFGYTRSKVWILYGVVKPYFSFGPRHARKGKFQNAFLRVEYEEPRPESARLL